jgi:hypothetical protein
VVVLEAQHDVTTLQQTGAHDAEGDSHPRHGTDATGQVIGGALPRPVWVSWRL